MTSELTDIQLRRRVYRSLRLQGYEINRKGQLLLPDLDKESIRKLHEVAVEHRVARARRGLFRHEERLLKRIANGKEVAPTQFKPRLIEVKPDTEDELLFRYTTLHWSIPVSSGYGRRLRFLLVDEHNDKLIGVLGLGDPVFALGPRDHWIGWDKEARRNRLQNVMDAFVLGAVPPYSHLLCGKLMAMLTASTEVRLAFERKYRKKTSLISERRLDGRLVLVTTLSALGRSSIYNRLRYRGQNLLTSVGFSAGSGEFHFSNGLYSALSEFAESRCEPTAKHEQWGKGFRSRREVIKKALRELNLSPDLLYHGIAREVFVAPMATNAREFLRGEAQRVRWLGHSVDDLASAFQERWMVPRSRRDSSFRTFSRSDYTIWNGTSH